MDESQLESRAEAPAVAELSVGAARRAMFVIDDVVSPEVARAVSQIVERLPFRFADYDRPDTMQVRHWVHPLPARCGTMQPVLDFLVEFGREFLRARGFSVGAMKRAYVNLNLFGDYQFAHEDGDVWTLLFFAVDDWHEDWGGELIVYDDSGKPDHCVSPRRGRAIVFDGRLRHRGGVPSKLSSRPRVTIAVKFTRSREERSSAP